MSAFLPGALNSRYASRQSMSGWGGGIEMALAPDPDVKLEGLGLVSQDFGKK